MTGQRSLPMPHPQEAALLAAAAGPAGPSAAAAEEVEGVRLGPGGKRLVRLKRRTFVPSAEQLAQLAAQLQEGQNTITFTYGKTQLRGGWVGAVGLTFVGWGGEEGGMRARAAGSLLLANALGCRCASDGYCRAHVPGHAAAALRPHAIPRFAAPCAPCAGCAPPCHAVQPTRTSCTGPCAWSSPILTAPSPRATCWAT